jgi:uncharacterized protein (TIGR02453 family)
MKQATIQQATIGFLKDLRENNNREWFNANKHRYEQAHRNMIEFSEAVLDEMRKHDKIETASGKASLFRIYADTRFSKDKAPYKTHWGAGYSRATQHLRGGYYFHIEPGHAFAAGGFWGPNADDLKRIREDIDINTDEWKELLAQPGIVKTFGKLRGDGVKTAPKGYDKNHEGIEWLRMKQFVLRHDFTDAEMMSPDFAKHISDVFRELRPFFDYMSEVLTTDRNGEPLF